MRVLLSIKPEHVENIFSGIKRFEFRRRLFSNRSVKTVVIYSTRPVAQLVGEFDIEEFLSATPRELWKKTSNQSGITKAYYDNYFYGRSEAFAMAIGDVRRYNDPVSPKQISPTFTPPQSYMYVRGAGLQWLESRQTEMLLSA